MFVFMGGSLKDVIGKGWVKGFTFCKKQQIIQNGYTGVTCHYSRRGKRKDFGNIGGINVSHMTGGGGYGYNGGYDEKPVWSA